MSNLKLKAGKEFPELSISTVQGETIVLDKPREGFDWKLIVVYRGRFCPVCKSYLEKLDNLKDILYRNKVDLIAISADTLENAKKRKQASSLSFPIGYGLSVEQMEVLGLYISEPISPGEPSQKFSEPALFVINEKRQVQIVDISNTPFVRPRLESLVKGIEFVRTNNYPIRGMYN